MTCYCDRKNTRSENLANAQKNEINVAENPPT